MTPRQRQSRLIMQEKASRKKRRAIVHKLCWIGGSALCLSLAGGGVWVWKSGAAVRSLQATVDGAYGLTVKAGFSLQSLYLEGRNRTPMEEVEKALGVKKGDPILRVSIDEVREKLETIESVKMAAVERALPDTLYVRIVEREPVALWQNKSKVSLVDDNGVVMNDIDSAPYKDLPLIVGEGAPAHVRELLDILASEKDLARHFAAAVYVGERRWNIRLTGYKAGEIEVKLPEDKPMEAWKALASLQAKQQVLERDIKVIDLRLPDRLFMKLSPVERPSGTARET